MIRFLHKLFNYHKINELEKTMKTYRMRNRMLEEELCGYKGYKPKYQVNITLSNGVDEVLTTISTINLGRLPFDRTWLSLRDGWSITLDSNYNGL